MNLMNLKGTSDFMPREMKIRNEIIDKLRGNFERYGYLPIETSMLNYYDLLSYKYHDDAEILHEVYRLTDQGERELGLRYDLTVPFCKVVGLNKDLRLPFRRYEIGKVFRNGPVKTGRAREFYQCDIDVVGIDNRFIEAEQMMMAIETFKELGIDVIAKYNNRKLMSGLILLAGIEEEKTDLVIGIIDKFEKVSLSDIRKMLSDIDIEDRKIDILLELFERDLSSLEDLSDKNAMIKEGIDELKEIDDYLVKLGIKDSCLFTPTLARGLSIYTGIVFEFFDKQERLTCALGGGGRYDKIITNFMDNGNVYPAVGLSFGLEPIFTILKNDMQNLRLIDIYMVPLGTEVETLKLASIFRDMGYRVLIEMKKKKISKCFEYADSENIKYVMIIGEDEINTGKYKIKDMELKKENIYSYKELMDYLKSTK